MKRNGILFGIFLSLFIASLSGQAHSNSVSPQGAENHQRIEIQKEALEGLKGIEYASRFQYNPAGRRDPFQSFIKPDNVVLDGVPPLERVSIAKLQLVGVASTGGGGAVGAMVKTPDGKTYSIKNGTRIGSNKGRVKEIGAREVIIEEPYLNIFGRTDLKRVIMKLEKKKEGTP